MMDNPITSVGIVENPNRCPPSFEVIMKSTDQSEDCDLWRDTFFNRIPRYLCYSRMIQKHQDNLQEVLVGFCVINEKDSVPEGFTPIDKTLDSLNKATKKKVFCVKMSTRLGINEAIFDIIILSKNKKAPAPYSIAGDLNGLTICYKTCQISSTQLPKPSSSYSIPNPLPSPTFPPSDRQQNDNTINKPVYHNNAGTLILNAMFDIPFQINSSLTASDSNPNDLSYFKDKYQNSVDFNNEYKYSFILERSVVG